MTQNEESENLQWLSAVALGGPLCGMTAKTLLPFISHPEGCYRQTKEADREGNSVFRWFPKPQAAAAP